MGENKQLSDTTIINSEERKRKFKILSGKIQPIQSSFNLKDNEEAYYQFETERKADVQYTDSYTTGITKKKGIIGRAVVGDLVFGKAGAIIGGVTADNEINSSTRQELSTRTETIDKGKMLFTNKRILFVGKEVVSIPYDDILAFYFPNPSKPHYPHLDLAMEVRYPSMLKNESYILPNTQVELFFRGVLRLIGKDKSIIEESDVEKFINDEFIMSDRINVPVNVDGSINCPECDSIIKDYEEGGRSFIWFGSKSRTYTCPKCGRMTCNS